MQWKPIKDYEGMYEISKTGDVKTLRRPVMANHHGGTKYVKEKIIQPITGKKNYKLVRLQKYKRRECYPVHQLVIEYFAPEKSVYIKHIDGNHANNHIDNLEWSLENE